MTTSSFVFQPPTSLVFLSFLATGCETKMATADFALLLKLPGGLNQLQNLLDSCSFCPPDVLSLLRKKINQVMRLFPQGHLRPAVNFLQQFVRDTERFMRQNQLPAAQGQSFIAKAKAIMAQIEAQIASR